MSPRTAVTAGLLVWAAGVLLHVLGEAPMGLFPQRIYVIGAVASLVYVPVAALVGAWAYREA